MQTKKRILKARDIEKLENTSAVQSMGGWTWDWDFDVDVEISNDCCSVGCTGNTVCIVICPSAVTC